MTLRHFLYLFENSLFSFPLLLSLFPLFFLLLPLLSPISNFHFPSFYPFFTPYFNLYFSFFLSIFPSFYPFSPQFSFLFSIFSLPSFVFFFYFSFLLLLPCHPSITSFPSNSPPFPLILIYLPLHVHNPQIIPITTKKIPYPFTSLSISLTIITQLLMRFLKTEN